MSGLVRDCADAPEQRAASDALTVREVLDDSVGCAEFSLRLLRAELGCAAALDTAAAEELLFVLSGRGRLVAPDGEHELEPEAGALLGVGERYELANEGPEDLLIVAVALHEPLPAETAAQTRLSRLADQAPQSATGERQFRIVFNPANGCLSATQFVGYIPVGAAPPHYHLYDEVIYVLEGDGVMQMNAQQAPLRAGSCIHLPARTVHTLANSGPGTMRVLGVFRPAGSPAAAFYPDGTPAYPADSQQTATVST
jgi:mannose-6-phosphate isomerase-like protein (cupin superfamily)